MDPTSWPDQGGKDVPVASVVVPTKDRPRDLSRSLMALAAQRTNRAFEVIVVDDGSTPAVASEVVAGLPHAQLLRLEGVGPASARNAGAASACGRVVLFTDDDTEADPSWVDAACAFLEQSPAHVGVEGPVSSPPYDPLRGHSLANEVPGAYWTCNIAYTRDALERLQGFFEGFPAPHCEDLDLAFRALQLGEIGFAPEMRVTHHPRSLSTRQLVQRGALAPNEVLLFERHRSRYGRVARLPSVVFPLLNIATVWGGFVKRNRRTLITSPGRLIRSVAIAGGQLAIATQSLVAWRLRRARGR